MTAAAIGSTRVGRRRQRAAWKQETLAFPNSWGGERPGAGRKRRSERRNVPHRARPKHHSGHPVHVTLRSLFRPLRSQHVFPTVCLAVRGATKRDERHFRILQFSVQWDHMHLVVEASDARALSSGVRSVAVRLARSVNDLVRRRGRLWADRWHGRELTSPRQVRNAFVYVLANFRKHEKTKLPVGVDPFSSAAQFDGFRGVELGRALPRAGPYGALIVHVIVSRSRTWLASTGWRRGGLVGLSESPR